jgi:hypothetical protein
MFSSTSVHCVNCCEKHHQDGHVTYYHQMLGAVVVHPDQKEVFPLCPEPISKTDGSSKNDCEQNAMKRFLADFHREHPQLEVVFTEDALGAKGPYLKRILEIGAHFIVNVNPTGNPGLIENETFNTLKNQGYQFERNFGHGYKNLSHVFGILMFLAFLIDQVQQRCCGLFQEALRRSRKKTRYLEQDKSFIFRISHRFLGTTIYCYGQRKVT